MELIFELVVCTCAMIIWMAANFLVSVCPDVRITGGNRYTAKRTITTHKGVKNRCNPVWVGDIVIQFSLQNKKYLVEKRFYQACLTWFRA